MPVSKRDKKVSLTKVDKKGKDLKVNIIEKIRKSLEKYNSLYVYTIQNMRNEAFKELREDWGSDSRFVFAKRRVMVVALGRSQAQELRRNLHQVCSALQGQCGLLFTNKPKDQVIQFFRDYSKKSFPKSGFVATETVTLAAGPLEQFDGAMEPHLRSKLGLPTQLVKGKIVLREDFTVCTAGTRLKPEQADLLKKLGSDMAEFKIHLICYWSSDGSFERLKAPKNLKGLNKTPQKTEATNKVKTPKQKKGTPKEEGKTPQASDPKPQNEQTPKATPKAARGHQTPKEKVGTPKKLNVTPMQVKEEPDVESNDENDNIDQNGASIKQEKPSPRKKGRTPRSSPQMPKQLKTPVKLEEMPMEVEGESEVELSSEIDQKSTPPKVNPRRSMRTPKPTKRTPDQMKVSVKKLTESARKQNATPKKGTPKRTVGTPTRKSFRPQKSIE